MPPLTRDEAATRAGLLAAVATEVDLDLTRPDRALVHTRVRVRPARPGVSTFLDAGFAVTAAWADGVALEVHDERIELPLPASTVVEVTGEVPYRRDGQGIHRFVDPADGAAYLHTKFQPFDAHRVFACFDQPDVKGPVTVAVTAPASWTVVGNQRSRSEPAAGGARRWWFTPTAPLPPYLVALVAGPFSTVRRRIAGLDVGLHARPELARHLDVDELAELTVTGRRYFERLLGIGYPFGDHYDIAFVPEYGFGAMEHPGCVTAHERFVFRSPPTAEQRRRRAEVLLHEMAHMWFGNLVTLRWWDDLWLNESFATLLASLAQAEATPTAADTWAVFAADAKVRARELDRLPTTHPVQGDVTDTAQVRSAFDAITYRKGAALLRQRLHETGRAPFLTGLRAFLRAHAHGNASAYQLHQALGPAGGRTPLQWAEDWLATTGHPEVHVAGTDAGWRLSMVPPEGRSVPPISVTVARLVPGPDAVAGTAGGTVGQLTLTNERAVSLAVGDPVVLARCDGEVALLANVDDGHHAVVVPDPDTLARMVGAVGSITDSVARSVVWAALWDAVVDLRLPAARYVDAVVTHGFGEPVPGVRQVIVERAVEAAWEDEIATEVGWVGATPDPEPHRDGDRGGGGAAPVHRPRARSLLARFAGDRLAPIAAGSDEHRLLTGALAAVARTARELADLRAAAAGYDHPDLAGDHRELRWEVMAGRCRAGDAGERDVALLASEETSDLTRRGELRARASWPTAEAKAAAWQRTLGDGLSLAERQAVVAGWAAPGQDGLRRAYETAFLPAVVRLARDWGVETALAVVRGGFPAWPADVAAISVAVGRIAGGGAVAEPVTRALVEQVARLERRCRVRDVAARDVAPR